MNLSRLFASNILWRGTYLVTSLLVTVLMARFLEAALTGELMYYISLFTFIFMSASFSLESALVYFSSSKKINDAKLFTFCLMWIPMVVFLLIPLFYYFFNSGKAIAENLPLYLCGLLFVAGNLLITYFSSFFYAKHQNRYPNLVFIFTNLIIVCVLIWSLTDNSSLPKEWFTSFYFISFFVQGCICVFMFAWFHPSSFALSLPSKEETKFIFNYASIAFAANILSFLLARIDFWFIEWLSASSIDLGNYIQASRLVQLFQLLPVILASTIFPAVSGGSRTDMVSVIQQLSRLIFWIYILIIVLIALTGKWLFPFVFGDSFSDMYGIFLILSPGLLATTIMALICAYIAAINKVRYNVLISVAGLLLIVPLDLILIPQFGIEGAAIVSSTGYIVSFITSFYFLRREENVKLGDFLLVKRDDVVHLLRKLNEIVR
jgi:O-antigen/teichoic acid export membrane protein